MEASSSNRSAQHNVAAAFALTFGAGLATVLGGFVVCSKRLVYAANPTSLAIALSISVGVMLFISLVELFNESVHYLESELNDKAPTWSTKQRNGCAWLFATLCFGLGIGLIYVIDWIVHIISPEYTEVQDIENLQTFELDEVDLKEDYISPSVEIQSPSVRSPNTPNSRHSRTNSLTTFNTKEMDGQTKGQLQRMGILSALAIGIHNIPEGIATFVGAYDNSTIGLSLAVGIALHNIPEGIAVAAPIYFTTGSRWRGILWCVLSALAEPFGGFIAWLVLRDGLNALAQGILFGLVCGIMVCISMKELLPTAFQFANKRTHLVTLGSFGGMFIMVLSLVLFAFAGV